MENWFNVEFILLKILDLQPSELDRLEFHRAEYLMENLKDWNEKEKEHRKKEEDETQSSYDMKSMQSQASNMFKSANSSMPKMPNFGNLKL